MEVPITTLRAGGRNWLPFSTLVKLPPIAADADAGLRI